MVKIAVLASFNMDLVMRVERRPEAGETLQGEFAMHLGGKGFNQAVAARRLGAEVVVCGRVGDDEFGRMFLEALDAEGIDRRAVVVDPEAGTGVATIYVEPDGTNTIVQAPRANWKLSAEDVKQYHYDILGEANVFLAQLETSEAALRAFAPLASCCTVGDGFFLINLAPALPVSDETLTHAFVAIANEVELAMSTGLPTTTIDELSDACRGVRRRGARSVIATLGAAGSLLVAYERRERAAAFAVDVVDTTGAGDAFCGALAVRLAEGSNLSDAMRFANAAGALACTKHGAYPSMPYRADVEALMREQGSGV
jgi:ribokinase